MLFNYILQHIPMRKITLLISLLLLYACTNNNSIEKQQNEGLRLISKINQELSKIKTADDLESRSIQLQKLFDRLAENIIKIEKIRIDRKLTFIEPLEKQSAEKMRLELHRIYHIENGRKTIEKTQQTALQKLTEKEFKTNFNSH